MTSEPEHQKMLEPHEVTRRAFAILSSEPPYCRAKQASAVDLPIHFKPPDPRVKSVSLAAAINLGKDFGR